MRTRPASAKPKAVNGKAASPYGYPFWDWVAREDPEYVKARQPLSALSIGEGKELSIRHREMVIIGILRVPRAGRTGRGSAWRCPSTPSTRRPRCARAPVSPGRLSQGEYGPRAAVPAHPGAPAPPRLRASSSCRR